MTELEDLPPLSQYLVNRDMTLLLTTNGDILISNNKSDYISFGPFLGFFDFYEATIVIGRKKQDHGKGFSPIHFTCEYCEEYPLGEKIKKMENELVQIYLQEHVHPHNLPSQVLPLIQWMKESMDVMQFPMWYFEKEKIKLMASNADGSVVVFVTQSNSIYVHGMKKLVGRSVMMNEREMFTVLRPPKSVSVLDTFEYEFMTSTSFEIQQVACGKNFVVVLCRNLEVFVVGENSMSSIGLKSNSFYGILQPLRFESLIGESVKEIACGELFSAFLTSTGNVYLAGTLIKRPTQPIERLHIPNGMKAEKICAHKTEMVVLLEGRRHFYYSGKVGTGFNFVELIIELSQPTEYIIDLYCGGEYMELITNQSRVFTVCVSDAIQKKFIMEGHQEWSTKDDARRDLSVVYSNTNIKTLHISKARVVGEIISQQDNICLTMGSICYKKHTNMYSRLETKDVIYMKHNLNEMVRCEHLSDVKIQPHE